MKVSQPPLGTPIKRSHPLSQGMVGCWLLNEGGGKKALDSTKLSRTDGALTGSSIASVVLQKGRCVQFSSGNYIDLGTPPALDIQGQGTWSAWIYPTSVTGTQEFIASNGVGINHFNFEMTGTQLRFRHSTFSVLTNAITLAVNTWYHVVFVRTGSTGAWSGIWYVNGVVITSNVSSPTINPTAVQPTAIGRAGSNATSYFTGSLKDIIVWNRALFHNEIKGLYGSPYCMF